MIFMGEIVAAFPPDHKDNIRKQRYEYTVRIDNLGGTQSIIKNCVFIESVSGLIDSIQKVGMASGSGENPTEAHYINTSEDLTSLTLGDRVIIGLINNNYRFGVILGCYPHPLNLNSIVPATIKYPGQVNEFKKNQTYPSYRSKLNGIDLTINPNGDLFLYRNGVTLVKQDKPLSVITTEPPKADQFFGIEILEKGVFRAFDNIGNIFEMNPITKTMFLSNGDVSIKLIQDTKMLQVVSSGKIEELCGTDWNKIIKGNETIKIEGNTLATILKNREIKIDGNDKFILKGNQDQSIQGNVTLKIDGKLDATLKDKFTLDFKADSTLKFGGKLDITSIGDMTIKGSGNAELKLASGKVALGAGATELFDQLIQLLTQMETNAPLFVSTAVGPGVLNPAILAIVTAVKLALTAIKGSL